MRCTPQNSAQRTYRKRFSITMLLYVACLFLTSWVFKHLHPIRVEAYLLAILPALPVIGSLIVVGLYLAEEPDEFERSVVVQSMLWGIGATLGACTAWGFLESFTPVPHIPAFYAYVIFWFVVGIANPIVRRRYQ